MPTPSVPVNGAVMHLQKTPCGRGACPVFSLHIFADGRAVYEGGRNAPRSGTWERRLSTTEVNALRNRFDQSGFWQLRDQYAGNVMDISSVYLSYSKGQRTKQVLIRNIADPPAAFQQLADALEALVSSGEWTQPETTSSPATDPATPTKMTPTKLTPKPADTPPAPTTPTEKRAIRRR